MAEFKLKDLSSLSLKPGDKLEAEVEGIEGGKVLIVSSGGQIHALNANCTHFGAPLKNGVLTPDGRLTCPWHGACFNVSTGDVEDAPAPDHLNKFSISEKNGGVYIKGEQSAIKSGRRAPNVKCSAKDNDSVVIVGGGSGTFGFLQALRDQGFNGKVTLIGNEAALPFDRTKLSKALIPDPEKLLLRPQDWYKDADINVVSDTVNSVDTSKKSVSTQSGKSYPYSKLVLATGGSPKRLPLPGFKELGNIFVLRTVTDVQAILGAVGDKGKKIVVVGSSFIGMEVANALAKENTVSVIGMEKAPLERVMGEEVGQIFQKTLEKNGVKFYMSASMDSAVPSASNSKAVGGVKLKDGTALEADLVILGVGVAPETGYLKDSSVQLEKDGSIKTDESFAVQGLKDVYAIGDIATYPYHGPGGDGAFTRIEHWNVAQNAGKAVGTSLAGHKAKPFIPIFWSALGSQLRYCGNTPNGWDELVLKGEPENGKFAAYYAKGETIVAVASMMMDPIMAQSAELMRRGKMPSKSDLKSGVNPLEVDLPKQIKI
ncbi:MAG: hypothetical protein Q9160_005036 [Pyrenula sp. 1 TL-2023]